MRLFKIDRYSHLIVSIFYFYTQDTMPLNIPVVCYSGGLIGAGVALAITMSHRDMNIPSHCVASAFSAVAGVSFGLAHHTDLSVLPPWYCSLGGAAGLSVGVWAYKNHVDDKSNTGTKVPLVCVLGTILGTACLTAGLAMALKQ